MKKIRRGNILLEVSKEIFEKWESPSAVKFIRGDVIKYQLEKVKR